MNLHLVEFSIVVAAQNHNPTILNPDFLIQNRVIPSDWKLSGPPITTPPFASVQYDSGVTLIVEPNKSTVTDQSSDRDPLTSDITEIAKKYVQALQHVRYTAVGINFDLFLEVPDVNSFLKDRFLKPGPWNNADRTIEKFSTKFVYKLEDGVFNLPFGAATLDVVLEENTKKTLRGILFKANFHHVDQDFLNSEQVIVKLNHVGEDWKTCQETIIAILGGSDG